MGGWKSFVMQVIHENSSLKTIIFNLLDEAKTPSANSYLSLIIAAFPTWSNRCHKSGMRPSRPFSVHLWTRVYPYSIHGLLGVCVF